MNSAVILEIISIAAAAFVVVQIIHFLTSIFK